MSDDYYCPSCDRRHALDSEIGATHLPQVLPPSELPKAINFMSAGSAAGYFSEITQETQSYVRDTQVFELLSEKFHRSEIFSDPQHAQAWLQERLAVQPSGVGALRRLQGDGAGEVDALRQLQEELSFSSNHADFVRNAGGDILSNTPGVDLQITDSSGNVIEQIQVKSNWTTDPAGWRRQVHNFINGSDYKPDHTLMAPKEVIAEARKMGIPEHRLRECGSVYDNKASGDRLMDKVRAGEASPEITMSGAANRVASGAMIGAGVELTVAGLSAFLEYRSGRITGEEAAKRCAKGAAKGAITGGALAGISLVFPPGWVGVGLGFVVGFGVRKVITLAFGEGAYAACLAQMGAIQGQLAANANNAMVIASAVSFAAIAQESAAHDLQTGSTLMQTNANLMARLGHATDEVQMSQDAWKPNPSAPALNAGASQAGLPAPSHSPLAVAGSSQSSVQAPVVGGLVGAGAPGDAAPPGLPSISVQDLAPPSADPAESEALAQRCIELFQAGEAEYAALKDQGALKRIWGTLFGSNARRVAAANQSLAQAQATVAQSLRVQAESFRGTNALLAVLARQVRAQALDKNLMLQDLVAHADRLAALEATVAHKRDPADVRGWDMEEQLTLFKLMVLCAYADGHVDPSEAQLLDQHLQALGLQGGYLKEAQDFRREPERIDEDLWGITSYKKRKRLYEGALRMYLADGVYHPLEKAQARQLAEKFGIKPEHRHPSAYDLGPSTPSPARAALPAAAPGDAALQLASPSAAALATSPPQTGYGAHQAQVMNLLELAEQTMAQLSRVGMRGWVQRTVGLTERLQADTFKVLVLGEFKRGKSTFINALLKEPVLPAYSTPCTAVINELRYGPDKTATVFFRTDLQPDLLPELPTAVEDHLKRHGLDQAPPLEVPIDELESFVVIPEDGDDHARAVRESPYDHVEIEWPLELCKNGVEIIDSPGLNEQSNRTKVSLDYLSSADAVVLVMSCHQLASQSELEMIEGQLKAAGHQDLFFIVNRWDEIREEERERVRRYAEVKLSPHTTRRPSAFFLSAHEALEGRQSGDQARTQASGIEALEAVLAEFLVRDRGRLKLSRARLQLLYATQEALTQKIPTDRELLLLQSSELQARVDAERPEIDMIRKEQARITERMQSGLRRLEDNVAWRMQTKLTELASKIEPWVKGASGELKAEMTMFTFNHKAKAQAIGEEISELIATRLREEQEAWVSGEFVAYIQSELEQLFDAATPEIQALVSRVDMLRARVAGLEGAESADHMEDVGGLERALAGTAGLFLGGAGSAMIGATLGGAEMAKSLMPSIALTVGAMMLGVTNPLILVPMLLTAGGLQGALKSGQVTDKVRIQSAKHLRQAFEAQAPELARAQAKRVIEQSLELVMQVDAALQAQLQAATQSFEDVLATQAAGEAEVQAQRAVLDRAEAQLTGVRRALTAQLEAAPLG